MINIEQERLQDDDHDIHCGREDLLEAQARLLSCLRSHADDLFADAEGDDSCPRYRHTLRQIDELASATFRPRIPRR